MPLFKTHGIVIKQINLGEADKIITLFTDKLGKVDAVAHGSRKPKSRLLSSTQVFCYGEYMLYKGKTLYTINQADIIESFQRILSDLYTLTYVSYMIELIDILTEQEESNLDLFALLLKTMYLMTDENIDRELLIRAFEIKCMAVSGYMPNLYECSVCNKNERGSYNFSSRLGGLVCSDCSRDLDGYIKIDASTIGVMRYILKSGIENLRTLKVSEQNKNEMKKILKNYIKYYLEKEFKSLEFLDDIKNADNL